MKIEMKLGEGESRIKIDGHAIEHAVTEAYVSVNPHKVLVHLTLAPERLEIEGDAHVLAALDLTRIVKEYRPVTAGEANAS